MSSGKQRGRPTIKGEKLTTTLRVRFTPTDRKALERRAGARGMKMSDWARLVLLKEIRKGPV